MQNLTIFEPYLGPEIVTQLSTINPVAFSGVLLIASMVIATIVLLLMKIATRQIATRTKTELDDKLLEAGQEPVFRLIIVGGIYLAVSSIGLEGAMVDVLLKIILTIAYLVVILFVVKALDVVVKYGLKDLADKTDTTLDDEIIPIFHKTTVVVVWAVALIMMLGVWGVDVAPFLAGLGIAGLAVSFALQPTLANIFAGVSLILDKAFKVGDKVQLESGEVGVVHDISLRSTRIRTYDHEIIIVPNDNLAKARIKNISQPDLRVRVIVPFSVEYGTDPDKVVKLISEVIKKNVGGILTEPPVAVHFTEMASSSLNFQAFFWVPHYDNAFPKKVEANNLIYEELNKAKIGIPFPTQTVYLKK